MDHASFVASIIKHGLAGDIDGIRRYADELVACLKKDGEDRPAAMIERAASGRIPAPNERISFPEARMGFPALPPYSGCWCPVYWTPVMGSGERLAAWIVARGDDGQTCLRRTIKDEMLSTAFGQKKTEGLLNIFAMVEENLSQWLVDANPYTAQCGWKSPLSGFRLGPWRASQANNIRQLAAQGVRLEAAFADPTLAELNPA